MKEQVIEKLLLSFQKTELTEHYIYVFLSKFSKDKNKEILQKIAEDELRHYKVWRDYSKKDLKPNKFIMFLYKIIFRILGLTFVIKIMERNEEKAQKKYSFLLKEFPEIKRIIEDEEAHEKELISLIDEERLNYVGSMILGLNDALVELTGTLAGLSFALQKTEVVGIAGVITGISASFSMMSSEYLSKKSEGEKNPLKASFYTGIAYIFTVLLLVIPFFIFKKYTIALLFSIINVVLIISIFTFFVSVTKELNFKKRFVEMAFISLGVAGISFLIGLALRSFLGIDI
ncbi:MAG: VIT1/CCC1 transporter family protein [Candidatus Aminicenantia bacterium]